MKKVAGVIVLSSVVFSQSSFADYSCAHLAVLQEATTKLLAVENCNDPNIGVFQKIKCNGIRNSLANYNRRATGCPNQAQASSVSEDSLQQELGAVDSIIAD